MAIWKNLSTALILLAGLGLAAAADAQVFGGNGLSLAIDQQQLTISGVSKGGQVLVAGTMSQAPDRVAFRWHDGVLLTDDDQDGMVTWDAPWPVRELSAFAAVDLSTGVFGTYAGLEPAERVVPLPAPVVINNPVLEESSFSLTPGAEKTIFLVRAGNGVWQGQAAPQITEVGELEGNAVEAISLGLPASTLEPLGSSPALPPAPQVGDVVVVIDPTLAQLSIRQLDSTDIVNQ